MIAQEPVIDASPGRNNDPVSPPQQRQIRVLLADDHAVVRRGLTVFLQSHDDLALAGEASSGEEAIELCRHNPPDVVLMDLFMPGMDGAEATRRIRQMNPVIRVITLTSFRDFPTERLVRAAQQAGASHHMMKGDDLSELAAAIRRAAHVDPPGQS